MMRRYLLAIGALAIGTSSCGIQEEPGRFSVNFFWAEEPTEEVFMWVRVEEIRSDGTRSPLASAGPASYVAGEVTRLPLEAVPNGNNRIVVVDVREDRNPNLRVVFFGESEVFSIQPGDNKVVDVPLAFQPPPVAQRPTTLAMRFDGEERSKVRTQTAAEATLIVTGVNFTSVLVANDSSFSAGRQLLDLQQAGCMDHPDPPEVLDPPWKRCELSWDLNAGLADPEADGLRTVSLQVSDERYSSEVLEASVQVDGSAPTVLSAEVAPRLARGGQRASLSITFDEPLDLDASAGLSVGVVAAEGEPPVLTLAPTDTLSFEVNPLARIPDTNTYVATLVIQTDPVAGEPEVYGFAVEATDALGNASRQQILTDPESKALAFRIDRLAPQLALEASALPDTRSFGIEQPDNLPRNDLGFDFVMVEANPARNEDQSLVAPEVFIGGVPLFEVTRREDLDSGETRWGFRADYAVRAADWGGVDAEGQGLDRELSIAVRWPDAAGNIGERTYDERVRVDFAQPVLSNCSFTPERAALGSTLRFGFQANESVALVAPGVVLTPELPIFEDGPQVTGGVLFNWTSPAPTDSFAETLVATVQVRDEVGNPGVTDCTASIQLDTRLPVISNVVVSATPQLTGEDGRLLLGDGYRLDLSFTIADDALAGPPALWIADESLLSFEGSCEDGACAYSLSLAADAHGGLSGIHDVSILASDLVGNRLQGALLGAPRVELDFAPPAATCNLLPPPGRALRIGASQLLQVLPFEALADTPPVVEVRSGETLLDSFFALQPQSADTWEHIVTEGDPEAELTVRVLLEDRVGNRTPEGASACSGETPRFEIDGTPPALTRFELFRGTDEDLQPVGARLGPGVQVVAEVVTADTPVSLRLGGSPLAPLGDAEALDDGLFLWRFELASTGQQSEGEQRATLELRDAADNRRSFESAPVTLDFSPPTAECEVLGELTGVGQQIEIRVAPDEPLVLLEGSPSTTPAQIDLTLDPERSDPQGDPPQLIFSYVVQEGDPNVTWSFSLRAEDATGNRALEPLCVVEGSIDTQSAQIVAEATTQPARREFGIEDAAAPEDNALSFALRLFEPHPRVSDPPVVRIGGVPVGTLTPESPPDLAEGEHHYRFDYAVRSADWGAVTRELGVSLRWQDRVGNVADIDLLEEWSDPAPIRIDFEPPTLVECSFSAAEAGIGDTVALLLTTSEVLEVEPIVQVLGDFDGLDFSAPPVRGVEGLTWRFEQAVTAQDEPPGALRVTVDLLDDFGNAAPGLSCDATLSVDRQAPVFAGDATVTTQPAWVPAGAARQHLSEGTLLSASVTLREAGELTAGDFLLRGEVERRFPGVIARDAQTPELWTLTLALNADPRELPGGDYRLAVEVRDANGNTLDARVPAAPELRVDYQAPRADCFVNSSLSASGEPLRITVSVDEALGELPDFDSRFAFVLDAASSFPQVAERTWSWDYTPTRDDDGAWDFSLLAADTSGNPLDDRALCTLVGEVDAQPPALAGDPPQPNPLQFVLLDDPEDPLQVEASTLRFSFTLEERNPPPAAVLPQVRIGGRALGMVVPQPVLPGSSTRSFDYSYFLYTDDWGGTQQIVDVSLRWQDLAGNSAEIPVTNFGGAGGLTIDFAPPTAVDCSVQPAGGLIAGDDLDFTVTLSELPGEVPVPELRGGYADLGFPAEPVTSGGGRTLRWRLNVGTGDEAPGFLGVALAVTDAAGNPSEGSVCDIDLPIDRAPPRLEGGAVLTTTPEVQVDGVLALALKDGSQLDARATVIEAGPLAAENVTLRLVNESREVSVETLLVQDSVDLSRWTVQGRILGTPAAVPEGRYDLELSVRDAAGNRLQRLLNEAERLSFDYTAPVLRCRITPADATLQGDGTFDLVADVDEPLRAPPQTAFTGLGFEETAVEALSYSWRGGLPGPPPEDLEFSWALSVQDVAGNPSAQGSCAGRGIVDVTDVLLAPGDQVAVGWDDPDTLEDEALRFDRGNNVRRGSRIRINFAYADPEGDAEVEPRVKIGDTLLSVTGGGPAGWTFETTVGAADDRFPSGLTPVTVQLTDAAGNASVEALGTLNFDFAPPSAVCSAPPTRVGRGQLATLEVAHNELLPVAFPAIRDLDDAGFAFESRTQAGLNTTFRYTVQDGDDRPVRIAVDLEDEAGNRSADACQAAFFLDGITPALLSVDLPADYGDTKNGDADFTIQLNFSEVVREPAVSFGGVAATSVSPVDPDAASVWLARLDVDAAGFPGDGDYPVTVRFVDEAGNPGEDSASIPPLRLDVTAPVLSCDLQPDPLLRPARKGETIVLTVNTSEPIAGDPQVNAIRDLPGPDDESFDFLPGAGGGLSRILTLDASGPKFPDDSEFTIDVSVSVTDANGNTTLAPCTGSVDVDTKPLVASDTALELSASLLTPYDGLPLDALTSDGRLKTPGQLGERGRAVVSVTFDETPASPPTVTLGPRTLDPDGDQSDVANRRYVFIYDVVAAHFRDPEAPPEEIPPPQVLGVSLRAVDLAGNVTERTLGTAVLDLNPPGVVEGSAELTRADGFTNPGVFTSTEIWARADSAVDIELAATKLLALRPRVRSGTRFEAVSGYSAISTSVQHQLAATGTAVNVDHAVSIELIDLAGNQREIALGTIHYDVVAPNPVDPSVRGFMELFRAPWGAAETSGVERTQLRVCPPPEGELWPWCALEPPSLANGEALRVYATQEGQSGLQCTDELLGSAATSANSGLLLELGADRSAVCVAVGDAAGNESERRFVEEVEWVAGLGGKIADSVASNPHRVARRLIFRDQLVQNGDREVGADDGIVLTDAVRAAVAGAPSWRKVELVAAGGVPRTPQLLSSAGAYDAARGRVVVFGGLDRRLAEQVSNDLWEWDGVGWVLADPSDPEGDGNPAARSDHGMVYDAARGRTLLFGGQPFDADGVVWAWDGESWERIVPTDPEGDGNPVQRFNPLVAFDPVRGELYLHGGVRTQFLDDFWIFNGTSWRQVTAQAMGPNPSDGVMYVNSPGGDIEYMTSAGTRYLWNGSNFSLLDTRNQQLAGDNALTFNPDLGRVVAALNFSGVGLSLAAAGQFQWEFLEVELDDPARPGEDRRNDIVIYDRGRREYVLVGGSGSQPVGGPDFEPWVFDGENWNGINSRADAVPESCGDTGQCQNQAASIGYDPLLGRTYVFSDGSYIWTGRSFQNLNDFAAPSAGGPVTYDHGSNRLLLWGAGGGFDELYAFNSPGNWDTILPSGSREPGVFDGVGHRRYVRMFPRISGEGVVLTSHDQVQAERTTIELQLSAGTLGRQQLRPAIAPPSNVGPELINAAVAFDTDRKRLMVYSGYRSAAFGDETPVDELWEWDGRSWAQIVPTDPEGDGNPVPRRGGAAVYDSTQKRIVLFGGDISPVEQLNDVWAWNGRSWEALDISDPDNFGQPPARSETNISYDARRDAVILWGGLTQTGDFNVLRNEVWELLSNRDSRPAWIVNIDLDAAERESRRRILAGSVRTAATARSERNGVVTGGVELLGWYRDGWLPIVTQSALPGTSVQIERELALGTELLHLVHGAPQKLNFAVAPAGINGAAGGQVELDAIEVTLRYRIDLDETCDDGDECALPTLCADDNQCSGATGDEACGSITVGGCGGISTRPHCDPSRRVCVAQVDDAANACEGQVCLAQSCADAASVQVGVCDAAGACNVSVSACEDTDGIGAFCRDGGQCQPVDPAEGASQDAITDCTTGATGGNTRLWEKVIGAAGDELAYDALGLEDGGILIVGSREDGGFPRGEAILLDDAGNLVRRQSILAVPPDRPSWISAVSLLPKVDPNPAVSDAGFAFALNAELSNGDITVEVVFVDADLQETGRHTVTGNGRSLWAHDLVAVNSQELVAVGAYDQIGAALPWISRFDRDGDERFFDDQTAGHGCSVAFVKAELDIAEGENVYVLTDATCGSGAIGTADEVTQWFVGDPARAAGSSFVLSNVRARSQLKAFALHRPRRSTSLQPHLWQVASFEADNSVGGIETPLSSSGVHFDFDSAGGGSFSYLAEDTLSLDGPVTTQRDGGLIIAGRIREGGTERAALARYVWSASGARPSWRRALPSAPRPEIDVLARSAKDGLIAVTRTGGGGANGIDLWVGRLDGWGNRSCAEAGGCLEQPPGSCDRGDCQLRACNAASVCQSEAATLHLPEHSCGYTLPQGCGNGGPDPGELCETGPNGDWFFCQGSCDAPMPGARCLPGRDSACCNGADCQVPDGSSAERAVTRCTDVATGISGRYWIDVDGNGPGEAIEVYCDLESADPGWMLVFSLHEPMLIEESHFNAHFGHGRITDADWSVAAGGIGIRPERPALVPGGQEQGAIGVGRFWGHWTDLRVGCNRQSNVVDDEHFVVIPGYATSNGNHYLLGAVGTGASYAVDAANNSLGLTQLWHDNGAQQIVSNAFTCGDTAATDSTLGTGQFAFCISDFINTPPPAFGPDQTLVGISFGQVYGSDFDATRGAMIECGAATPQDGAGSFRIWIR